MLKVSDTAGQAMPEDETPSSRLLQPDPLADRDLDLYPSLRARLKAILASDDPAIRSKIEALAELVARRDQERGQDFAQRYGLTPSEVRLARHLAEGGNIAGYAEQHGLSQGTVRTHLKAVFAKTGAHRQAELVLLLAGGLR
jgi:DNA-binding CsgD family transcriptional regulator